MSARTPLALVAITVACVSAPARAQSRVAPEHRWGIAVEFDPVALPAGHLGIPLGADESAFHLASALTFRYQFDAASALDVGLGLASPALGASTWVDYERFARLAADARGIVALELYCEPGLQLGFAGPDYYARHSDVFVGYAYAAGGPPAFALRFPTGLRASFAHARFDVYAASVPQLLLAPDVEVLFVVSTGVRVRF